jgi:hypothetical protein
MDMFTQYVVRLHTLEREMDRDRHDAKILSSKFTTIPCCSIKDTERLCDAINSADYNNVYRRAVACVIAHIPEGGKVYVPVEYLTGLINTLTDIKHEIDNPHHGRLKSIPMKDNFDGDDD